MQPGQGDDLQSPGFHRALAPFRSGVHRRRRAERAEGRRALQGQRLSDDGAVHAGRRRDHAPARRGRCRPVHARPGDGHERRAAGEGNAGGGARAPAPAPRQARARGLAHARLLLVGHRRAAAHAAEGSRRRRSRGSPRHAPPIRRKRRRVSSCRRSRRPRTRRAKPPRRQGRDGAPDRGAGRREARPRELRSPRQLRGQHRGLRRADAIRRASR